MKKHASAIYLMLSLYSVCHPMMHSIHQDPPTALEPCKEEVDQDLISFEIISPRKDKDDATDQTNPLACPYDSIGWQYLCVELEAQEPSSKPSTDNLTQSNESIDKENPTLAIPARRRFARPFQGTMPDLEIPYAGPIFELYTDIDHYGAEQTCFADSNINKIFVITEINPSGEINCTELPVSLSEEELEDIRSTKSFLVQPSTQKIILSTAKSFSRKALPIAGQIALTTLTTAQKLLCVCAHATVQIIRTTAQGALEVTDVLQSDKQSS